MGRALVLGGGNGLARAWQVGLLSGLAAAGVDLAESADTVIGTSGGAILAAQILTGADYEQLYDEQLNGSRPETGRMRLTAALNQGYLMVRHRDPLRFRRAVGHLASTRAVVAATQRHDEIAAQLSNAAWPAKHLIITAVDAATGEVVGLTSRSGARLIQAVTASAAAPGVYPVATINGRAFIDGGVASATNLSLAAGHERIIVLAAPGRYRTGLVGNVRDDMTRLQYEGFARRVTILEPDAATRHVMRRNPTSPRRRVQVARAGRAQADIVTAMLGPDGLRDRADSPGRTGIRRTVLITTPRAHQL